MTEQRIGNDRTKNLKGQDKEFEMTGQRIGNDIMKIPAEVYTPLWGTGMTEIAGMREEMRMTI